MGESTNISWTNASWSPWWGCTIISPACTNCYAKAFSERVGHGKRLPTIWGPKAERRFMSDEHWKLPRRWNRKAARAGERLRVFCASMADVFEIHGEAVINERMNSARARLWALIEETPHLDWQLLTKRPENVASLIPSRWSDGWPENIWLGVTAENQEYANERIPLLIETEAAVKFVSYEPALGPIDFDPPVCQYCGELDFALGDDGATPFCPECESEMCFGAWLDPLNGGINQIIIGGESGSKRRPFDIEWVRSTIAQCRVHGVAVFVKQDAGLRPGLQGGIPDELWVHELPTSEDGDEASASILVASGQGFGVTGRFSMVQVEASGSAEVVSGALGLGLSMAASLRGGT